MEIRLTRFALGQFAFLTVFAFLLLGGVAQARQSTADGYAKGPASLGIILGEPTGLTGKFWLDRSHAVDVGLAFSFDSFVLIYSDYLFHFPGAFGNSSSFSRELVPYIGVGGEIFISESSGRVDGKYFTSGSSSAGFGVRIPFGLEWLVPKAPLGVFAELAPGIGILPSTFGFFQGGVGARLYF